jgi:hypothetical protein
MYRSRKVVIISIVVALFIFSGCAAKKITTVTVPVKTKLSGYHVMKIEPFIYDSCVEITNPEAAEKLRAMFQERVKYDIYKLSLFEKVVTDEPINDGNTIVLMKGRITYMKRVTRFTRIMAGAMAGRSRVDVVIQLADATTGELLGEADIKGTSKGGSIFAGGTEEAFENAAQLVAQFVQNHY